jgi:periplasmic protein TonB
MADTRIVQFVLIGALAWVFGARLLVQGSDKVAFAADGRPARRVHVRGDVMSKKLKHRVEPVYPQLARQQGVEGTVKLQVIVGVEGAVTEVKVLSGPSVLQKAAVDAVLKWIYEPTSIRDQVVEVETNVNITFSLSPGG